MIVELGFDPGLIHPAIAVAVDGVLCFAGRVKVPGKYAKIPDVGQRVSDIVELVMSALDAHCEASFVDGITYECMEIYKKKRGTIRRANPNDLIPLAMMGGELVGRLRQGVASNDASKRLVVRAPTPKQWSDGTQKTTKGDAWLSPRGGRLARLLTPAERACVDGSHDGIDSACILLYGIGRWTQVQRTLPGCTEVPSSTAP